MTLAASAPPRVDLRRWPDLTPPARTPARRVKSGVTRAIFRRAMRDIPVRVRFPDGEVWGVGGPDSPVMSLHRPDDFFARVGADTLIGFGESYQAGDWDADDLSGLLTELCRQITALVPDWMQRLRGLYLARLPKRERNTVNQTRGNISRHYDLSNELFAAFLDKSMTYSSALFEDLTREEPLESAQRRKVERLLDRARVESGTHLLEIGTGWGELALQAAARGARVTSVTLSAEQLALAEQRIRDAGYADQVELRLCDYREVTGRYDAIVSVEMIEAVGHEYWATYLETLDGVLAPGGRVALQAITMPHDRMLATRNSWTWINKYIFPGGFLPSTRALRETAARHTSLRLGDVLSMGPHYARTLAEWDRRFTAAADRVADLGFDEVFRRMWHFYLCYSRAGFEAGYLDVQQLVFSRDAA